MRDSDDTAGACKSWGSQCRHGGVDKASTEDSAEQEEPADKGGVDRDREATGEMGEWVTPDLISAATQGPHGAFLWQPCL